jgi:hypothetical protein
MYVGHFAIGLAIKAASPRTPNLPIMMGVGFMDIMDGIFVMLGIDRVTPNLQAGPYLYFDLTFIDWDHSLLMAMVLSLAWGALFIRMPKTALIAFLASFSHFLADWPMHNADLALYPHAAEHLGYGLWSRLGNASWALEGVFSLALACVAWRVLARRGISLLWPAVVLLVLFASLSPWLSPMQFIARLHPPAIDIAQGLMVAMGFILPGLLITWLMDRAERTAGATTTMGVLQK